VSLFKFYSYFLLFTAKHCTFAHSIQPEMKKKLFFILFFLYSASLFAQNKKTQAQYQKAKDFFVAQQYNEAVMAFDRLLKAHKGNIYVEYAHYYTALSLFHLKKYKDAEKILEKLSEKYPQWNKMQEVLYLQANIAFERKEDNIAISYIEKIKPPLAKDAQDMKAFYLGKRDLATLKNLQIVYPKDKTIAQILVDKLAVEGSTSDLEKQQVHFIDPDYTKLGGDRDKFRIEYNQKVRHVEMYSNMIAPPLAAHKGYDLTLSFIKTLYQNKENFYEKIENNENFIRTYRGYVFTEKDRDNQYVPILKYVDKKLIVANPLYEEKPEPKKEKQK